MNSSILLVGAGPMARAYVDVLKGIGVDFFVVGRSKERSDALAENTGVTVVSGGLTAWLKSNPVPGKAIVATSVETLEEIATELVSAGCPSILLEKPGAIDSDGIRRLNAIASKSNTLILLGFNRRYYASVARARDIIADDGGLSSAFFDFTELGYRIETLDQEESVKENWFLANSLHVVDLAFHLIGTPADIETRVTGSLPWHHRSAQFAGSGVTELDVSFAYRADWAAPGRWKVELFTKKHRLLLSPMEILQVQKAGSFDQVEVELNDRLDKIYKPGLYHQVEAWLENDIRFACSIADHVRMASCYDQIAGY